MAPQDYREKDSSEHIQQDTSHNKDKSSSTASQEKLQTWAESSCFQSLSYSYMNQILNKGQQQFRNGKHLELEDLYAVPPDMEAEHLGILFW